VTEVRGKLNGNVAIEMEVAKGSALTADPSD